VSNHLERYAEPLSPYVVEIWWQPNHDCFAWTYKVYRIRESKPSECVATSVGHARYGTKKHAMDAARQAALACASAELEWRMVSNPGKRHVTETYRLQFSHAEVGAWQEEKWKEARGGSWNV
jgi:hypothetical protein